MSETKDSIAARLFPGLRTRLKGRRSSVVLLVLCLILAFVVVVSADKGAVEINPRQIFAIILKTFGFRSTVDFSSLQESTLLEIRLPRIALGLLVGAALGISGAAMQGLFRNPLADPTLVGISSGAALAATAVVIIGDVVSFSLPPIFQLFAFPVAAFAGALATTLIIYRLSTIAGQTAVATLLLAGIAINALAQAFSGFLTFYATDTQIRSLTFWKLGSLGGGNWSSVAAFGAPEKVFTPEIIRETFGVEVGVIKHPHFDCPLIVWRGEETTRGK